MRSGFASVVAVISLSVFAFACGGSQDGQIPDRMNTGQGGAGNPIGTAGNGNPINPNAGMGAGIGLGGGGTIDPCEDDPTQDGCELVPSGPACGDGELNQPDKEVCDDGNSLPGDCCSGICQIEAYCECPVEAGPCWSTIVCGDGVLGPGEACDDGNTAAGDGCAANCRLVEPGHFCRTPGQLCERRFVCGDGSPDPNEGCDDGNLIEGDGCNARCRLENGFKCSGTPSMCTPTTCGDNVQEGAESCDDGNAQPFDGCGATCRAEPICTGGVDCTSSCGDGIVLNEDCDDGNLRDGDGCSSSCTQEEGYVCSNDMPCIDINGMCAIQVPVVYRDFSSAHPDFEPGATGCMVETPGIAAPTLDAEGKPTLAQAGTGCGLVTSADTFATWYRDSAPDNASIATTLTLWQNDAGAFVNRWGPNGEQWQGVQANVQYLQWCGPAGSGCMGDTNVTVNAECLAPPAGTQCYDPCTGAPGLNDASAACLATSEVSNLYDGDPVFFPIDGQGLTAMTEYGTAVVPEPIYAGNWQPEPGGALHNFHFTSEVKFWFQYDPAAAQVLDFDGDDDVWVFLAGQRSLDLGGIHVPVSGTVDIGGSAAALGLEAGHVYQIAVFQAERQTEGSSYRLTLSGFNMQPSDCVTDCGDAMVGPGEECDDGINDGGYGPDECSPGCVFGPRCGDAVVQADFGELCDDGVNAGNYGGCSPDCQLGPHCGDGVVQTDAGEQCDDGMNEGGYGMCSPGCVIGPYCGDGIVQDLYEQCDDANQVLHDGCTPACVEEVMPPE